MVATRVSTRKSNERPKRQRRASSKFDNSSSNDKDDKPEPPAPRTKDMKPKSNKTTDNKKKNAKAASAPVKGKAVAKVESTATKKKKAPPQDNTKTASKGKGKNNDHKKTSASKNTKKKTKAAAKLEAANKSDNNTDDSSTSFEQKEARVKLRVDGALSKGFRYALLDSSKSENEDDVPKPKSSAAKRKEPSTKQTNDDDNSTNRNQDIRVSVKLDKEVGVRVKVAKKQMKGKQLAVVNDHDLSEGSSDGGQLVATRKKPPKITIRMGKGKKKKEEGEEQEEEEVAVAPSTTKEEEIDDVIDDVTEPKEGETVESTPKTEVATTKTDATETSDKKRARDEEETNEEEKVAEEVAEEEKAPPAKKARVSQFGNSVDPKRLCIMDGCDKYKKARCGGYCLFHYDALSDEERAEIIKENELKKMKMAPEKKRCKVEGCGKYFKARHDGMCLTCYREFHGITKNGPSNFSGGELPPVEMIGGVDEQTLSMMLPPVMNEICVPAVASRAPSGPKPAKYCIFEGCMKYKQKGCLGYCLTHKEFGDPELHRLQKETAAAESALKRKSVSKSSLCKVEGCEKYKQANCNGYCLEHVKTLAAYDDDDLEYVTKVRVRCDTRLQNGFCVAILSEESRDKLGLKRPLPLSDEDEVSDDPMPDEDDEVSDDPMLDEDEGDKVDEDVEMEQNDDEDEQEPAAEETAAPTLGEPDFEISNVIRRKENGALLCKAVGCLKIAQTKDDGFCRTHYNRFQISTGRIESWQCKCGERIAISSLRCGKCHRWKDGHHPSSSPQRSLAPSSARTCVPADAGVEISDVLLKNARGRPLCKVIGCGKAEQSNNDGFCRTHFNLFAVKNDNAEDPSERWTCVCGEEWSIKQKRCGNSSCQKWQGGKRDSYNYTRSTGISRDNIITGSKWTCDNCGAEVDMRKSRCGKCHRWRGGKRQGGWTLGSATNYDSDDGIDRTKDWTCDNCNNGEIIAASQSRCGKCNRWRGGKRRPTPWECSKCNMSNPGSKRRCAGCLTWRGKTKTTVETNAVSTSAEKSISSFQLPMPTKTPLPQAAQMYSDFPESFDPPDIADPDNFGAIDLTKLSFVNYDFNQSYYENSDYSYLTGSSTNSATQKEAEESSAEKSEEKKEEVETS